MLERLQEVETRYEEITSEMARPEVASNPEHFQKLTRELHGLEETVSAYRTYRDVVRDLEEADEILETSDD
ncbi:MAG: PCRF domain-containing protein, partial [Acidimicrobiales bacterium]|nr:PCRF domain-containing protein [Acidimicrobiales bacterium]